MPINPASPQDTFDHVFGSGATQFSWWRGTEAIGDFKMSDLEQPDNWRVEVTAENPEGGENVTVTVDHKTVMRWARKLATRKTLLGKECRNLAFNADEADFDAVIGDTFLQFITYGQEVFG